MATSKHSAMRGVFLTAAEATFYDAQFDAENTYAFADRSTQAKETSAANTRDRAIAAAAITAGQSYLGAPARTALHERTAVFV